jgi:hypothetical protein
VTDFSERILRFNPGPVKVKIVVVKVTLGQRFSRPLSLLVHQCPAVVLIYFLPREWARPEKLSESGEHYTHKALSLFRLIKGQERPTASFALIMCAPCESKNCYLQNMKYKFILRLIFSRPWLLNFSLVQTCTSVSDTISESFLHHRETKFYTRNK